MPNDNPECYADCAVQCSPCSNQAVSRSRLHERHFNELTPAQDERLAWLIEECAEVIQAATKIQRHGYESVRPSDPTGPTNRGMLEAEVADVFAIVQIMQEQGDICKWKLPALVSKKREKLPLYAHHNF